MLSGVFANPTRAGSCRNGEMLRVAQLNCRDGFRNGVSPGVDGNLRPSGARIEGMEEGTARATCPNIVAAGGNGLESGAGSDRNKLKGLPAVRGALHFAIGGNTPERGGRASHKFHHLARCRHFTHARLGCNLDGSPSGGTRSGFSSGDLCRAYARIPSPDREALRRRAHCLKTTVRFVGYLSRLVG